MIVGDLSLECIDFGLDIILVKLLSGFDVLNVVSCQSCGGLCDVGSALIFWMLFEESLGGNIHEINVGLAELDSEMFEKTCLDGVLSQDGPHVEALGEESEVVGSPAFIK